MMLKDNVCFIWKPHVESQSVRCATRFQTGEIWNYVVICCDPEYNGIYRWRLPEDGNWMNIQISHKQPHYVISFLDLEWVSSLEEAKSDNLRNRIKWNQDAWARETGAGKQDWFISSK